MGLHVYMSRFRFSILSHLPILKLLPYCLKICGFILNLLIIEVQPLLRCVVVVSSSLGSQVFLAFCSSIDILRISLSGPMKILGFWFGTDYSGSMW